MFPGDESVNGAQAFPLGGDDGFVDFYELLQISPNAETETINRIYRMLAARYHPDNPETGDMDLFLLLKRAHEILSDPHLRAEYDALRKARLEEPLSVFSLKEFAKGIDGEANRRMGVLCLLYNRRRMNHEQPGVSVLELENLMSFPREHLMFALWYLKEKGYIQQDEHSNYAISAAGVDYVEANLPKNKILYKLLKAAEFGTSRTATVRDWAAEEEQPAAR
jgi:curved DNA-binding protein CbpA